MTMVVSQYPALKSELTVNPAGYPYGSMVLPPEGSPQRDARLQAIADELNKPRTGSNGGPSILIPRQNITRWELIEAIDLADLQTNNNPFAPEWFGGVLASTAIRLRNDDGTVNRVKTNLDLIIRNGGAETQTRLNALSFQAMSRAYQLGWDYPAKWDVERALALP